MSNLQPVLVNSETMSAQQTHEQNAVIINTSAVPDFSTVRESENVLTKFTDTPPVVNKEPSISTRETNEVLKVLLNDLRSDFLSVVKLVDVLNRNVATYGDKVKNIEQNLNKLMTTTGQDDTSVAKIADLQLQIEKLTKQNTFSTHPVNTPVVQTPKQILISTTNETKASPFISSSKTSRQKIDVKTRFSSNRY